MAKGGGRGEARGLSLLRIRAPKFFCKKYSTMLKCPNKAVKELKILLLKRVQEKFKLLWKLPHTVCTSLTTASTLPYCTSCIFYNFINAVFNQ